MTSFIDSIENDFKSGTILIKLIYINIGVYLFFNILGVLSFLFMIDSSEISRYFTLPSNGIILSKRPWAIISYMFLHQKFLHILLNLLWLYFGGKLFLQYMTQKQLLSTYIFGGISGGVFFILAYNFLPVFSVENKYAIALGASASVLAIIFATATYVPNLSIRFPFIGSIKLKHIAIFLFFFYFLSIPEGNSGGHIAHIGGAIFGVLYVKQLRAGNDWSKYFNIIMNYLSELFTKSNKLKKVHRKKTSDQGFRDQKNKKSKKIDSILEKIASSGYDSLSKEEKDTLFDSSKK